MQHCVLHNYHYTKVTGCTCLCVRTTGRLPEAIRPEAKSSFFSASVDMDVNNRLPTDTASYGPTRD